MKKILQIVLIVLLVFASFSFCVNIGRMVVNNDNNDNNNNNIGNIYATYLFNIVNDDVNFLNATISISPKSSQGGQGTAYNDDDFKIYHIELLAGGYDVVVECAGYQTYYGVLEVSENHIGQVFDYSITLVSESSVSSIIRFQIANVGFTFDGLIDLKLNVESGSINGQGGSNYDVIYSVSEGVYNYTAMLDGYETLIGQITITSEDIGQTKDILLNFVVQE